MIARTAPYKAPRTASGAPDLQGIWTFQSLTKLVRPKEFKALVVSAAEAAAYESKKLKEHQEGLAPLDPNAPAPKAGKVEQEAEQWYRAPPGLARVRGEIRSSFLVSPADGKLPYRDEVRPEIKQVEHSDDNLFDDPETRPFDERCVLGVGGIAGPPLLNTGSNSNLQILQTRDHVLLSFEMIHDARIIRLGDHRHAPPAVNPWMGDSVGWWEGDTLVVETTNFNPGERWHWNGGSYVLISTTARVVERLTRTGPKEILYEFRVEDPAVYTQPWSGEMPLSATSGPLFEYACHEGNYALGNILAGARKAERDSVAAKSTPAPPSRPPPASPPAP